MMNITKGLIWENIKDLISSEEQKKTYSKKLKNA